jgi:hypothetical protein
VVKYGLRKRRIAGRIHAAEAAGPLRAWGGHVLVNWLSVYVNIDIRGGRIRVSLCEFAIGERGCGCGRIFPRLAPVELILANLKKCRKARGDSIF